MHGGFYDFVFRPIDASGLAELRRGLVSRASGRVLEVGVGTGLNLPFYSAGVSVIGIDPDADMLVRARDRVGPEAEVVEADAQDLPFADAEFDTVVATLVFCSIPDPRRAFQEVARVLKPGGHFLLLEHVRVGGIAGGVQDLLTPVWKHLAGGCHLNRNPEELMAGLPFEVQERGEFWKGIGRLWVFQRGA